MIDASAIIAGVTAGFGTNRLEEQISNSPSQEEIAQGIHRTLGMIHELLKKEYRDDTMHDLYSVVTVYKAGIGPAWTPDYKNRTYLYILVGVTMSLDVTSIIGTSTYKIPAGANDFLYQYTRLDLPENASIVLDAADTNNTELIYCLHTNSFRS